MGKMFKVGLGEGGLGAIWSLVTLNTLILSKDKVVNIGCEVCFGGLKEILWNFSKCMEDIQ